jgi:hypothetical protein
MILSNCQQQAADAFLDFMLDPTLKEMVISGFAGTGKSTLLQHLLKSVHAQMQLMSLVNGVKESHLEIHVTATTNQAAKVIAEMCNTQPRTIHSLLELRLKNDFSTGKQKLVRERNAGIVRNALIVVDEAGFIDSDLLDKIRKYTLNCKFLFIGDPYQTLVNTGRGVAAVFDGSIPQVQLKEVVRNQGPIEQAADAYRKAVFTGEFPDLVLDPNGPVVLVEGSKFQSNINKAFQEFNPDAKILAWTNERVHQYNDYVRNTLQQHDADSFPHLGEHLQTNKTIIVPNMGAIPTDGHCEITAELWDQVQYFPEIWDKEIHGKYVEINNRIRIWVPNNPLEAQQFMKLAAKQKNWPMYFMAKDQWADLRPVHASTVHKSQGATFDEVFIDLADIGRCNIPSDVARMLYVAISRARKRVVLYDALPSKYGTISYETIKAANCCRYLSQLI